MRDSIKTLTSRLYGVVHIIRHAIFRELGPPPPHVLRHAFSNALFVDSNRVLNIFAPLETLVEIRS